MTTSAAVRTTREAAIAGTVRRSSTPANAASAKLNSVHAAKSVPMVPNSCMGYLPVTPDCRNGPMYQENSALRPYAAAVRTDRERHQPGRRQAHPARALRPREPERAGLQFTGQHRPADERAEQHRDGQQQERDRLRVDPGRPHRPARVP